MLGDDGDPQQARNGGTWGNAVNGLDAGSRYVSTSTVCPALREVEGVRTTQIPIVATVDNPALLNGGGLLTTAVLTGAGTPRSAGVRVVLAKQRRVRLS